MLASVLHRVHHKRGVLLCLLAVAALLAVWTASSSAATAAKSASKSTAPSTGGTSPLKSSAGKSSGGTSGTTSTPASGEEETGTLKKTATSSGEESKSSASVPIIFGSAGAVILMGAIVTFIMRDARRNAPVPDGGPSNASTRMSAEQLRKRRTKAKAVRQQRKKNRPG